MVTSELTFNNLIIPQDDSEKDTFVATMEDIIKEVISENLSLDEGTTTAKIIAIDGEDIGQRKRLLYRRLATTSVIAFEIQQTVVAGGGVDTDEEELRQKVADALTLEGAKEALETEELRADYGDFTLGAIESDTGDGPAIIESVVRSLFCCIHSACCPP